MSDETERLNAEIDAAKKTMETFTGLYNKVVNLMTKKEAKIQKQNKLIDFLLDNIPCDTMRCEVKYSIEDCRRCLRKWAESEIDRS